MDSNRLDSTASSVGSNEAALPALTGRTILHLSAIGKATCSAALLPSGICGLAKETLK
jgi:hypothetical protein